MQPAVKHSERRLRGLWLARELPFPLDMGDKIYSANLARALAEAGADVTFVGLKPSGAPVIPSDWPIRWEIVPGKARAPLASLLSTMPMVAAAHATEAYRRRAAELADGGWDFVVLDQYALGWALPLFKGKGAGSQVLIHVAHDHEASVVESLYRGFRGSWIKRIVLWQNYVKTRRFEQRLASSVDLLTAITDEDADKFSRDAPGVRTVVLKPGYSGVISSRELISPGTPRRVILVGSFRWIAKQENLRQFVAVADPIFAERGIEFQVVGSVPAEFAKELTRTAVATKILGFVSDIGPYLNNARIAVVPEVIGGGFKLKFLDYVFGRVPVATLENATTGLPEEIRAAMLCCDDLRSLALGIADLIDRLPELNAMQETALRHAQSLFRWDDRGAALLASIRGCRAASCAD